MSSNAEIIQKHMVEKRLTHFSLGYMQPLIAISNNNDGNPINIYVKKVPVDVMFEHGCP